MKTYKYDPVCGKKMKDKEVYVEIEKVVGGEKQKFLLCCPECHGKFEKEGKKYIRQVQEIERQGEKIDRFVEKNIVKKV